MAHGKSVLFTGTPDAIAKLQDIIPSFDSSKQSTTQFYVYKPNFITASELQKRSLQVAGKLKDAGLHDPELLETLRSAKLTPSADAVTYVGTPDAIARLRNLIPTYDTGAQAEKARHKLCRFRYDHQIAGERKTHAATDRMPPHADNNRLF